jgi:subtilisin family serine protease
VCACVPDHPQRLTGGASNPSALNPLDTYGHGTHVAGLIGGDQAAVKGVVPGAKVVSLRVLSSLGQGQTSHVIALSLSNAFSAALSVLTTTR